MELGAEKQVIVIDKKLVPVSLDVYQTYYKMKRREKYQLEVEQRYGVQYYPPVGNEEFSAEGLLIDENQNVEQLVMEGIDRERVHHALAALTDSERELIIEIFFNEKSERGMANILGVYHFIKAQRAKGFSWPLS